MPLYRSALGIHLIIAAKLVVSSYRTAQFGLAKERSNGAQQTVLALVRYLVSCHMLRKRGLFACVTKFGLAKERSDGAQQIALALVRYHVTCYENAMCLIASHVKYPCGKELAIYFFNQRTKYRINDYSCRASISVHSTDVQSQPASL